MSTTVHATTSNIAAPTTHDPRLARPIFTLREAAGHLAVPASTLHAWARRDAGPLVTTVPAAPGAASVPFVGFAEAFALSAFRRAGLPLQRIRPAVAALRRELGLEHALASENPYTDGTEVLYRFVEPEEPELLELTVVRTGQKQFSEVVRNHCGRSPTATTDGPRSSSYPPTDTPATWSVAAGPGRASRPAWGSGGAARASVTAG